MRVLSIDFDYFQKVSAEQIGFYPDGVDNGTALSEIIWGEHYATYENELNSIGIMRDELNSLEALLKKQKSSAKVMIANSHKHIYEFIHKHMKEDEELRLVNIDMHHDIINENSKLDCGNWISFLIKEQEEKNKPISFKWIANPISLNVYGLEGVFEKAFGGKTPVLPSIKAIKNEKFDLIFLCRSDIWLPPHLDVYFVELYDMLTTLFFNIVVEQNIGKPRTNYLEMAHSIKSSINKLQAEYNDK